MNYERIYRDFIRDRMATLPDEGEYAEVHHILPKCMGGTDDPWNLIRLRPGDHFFAHLCLAKAHRLPELWAAVFMMLNLRDVREGKRLKSGDRKANAFSRGRRDYAWLMHRRPRGLDWQGADQTIYHFRHKEHGDLHCTRIEFGERTGCSPQEAWGITKGDADTRKSVRGWYCPERNTTGVYGREAQRENAWEPSADPEVYHIRHKEHGDLHVTQRQFMQITGLNSGNTSNLVRGNHKSRAGWYLPKYNPDGLIHGENNRGVKNRSTNQTVFHWSHDDGREEKLPCYQMRAKHGGSASQWSSVIGGFQNVCMGWMLHEARLRGGQKRDLTRGEVFTFVHPEKGEFTGTRAEITRHIGALPTGVTEVTQRKCNTVHGWSLKGAEPVPSKRVRLERTFTHPEHGRFTGARGEFAKHIAVSPQGVSDLISGRRRDIQGWTLVG